MLEKGKISGTEITYLMTSFILGTSVLLPPGLGVKQQAWQAVIGGMLESGFFVWIYIVLLSRFPGKTGVEIIETVFGRLVGKLLATLYILYLFLLGTVVTRNTMDFIKFTLLEQTPVTVILLVGLVACVYLVKSGVEVLGRCSQALLLLTWAMFLFVTFLLIPEVHFDNYFPLFEIPVVKLLGASHAAAAFPFAETVAFLMVFPFLNRKAQAGKSAFTSLCLGGLYLVLTSLRTVGVLGESAGVILYPAYHVARLIDVAQVFTRLEILVAVNFLTMSFLKISVLLYGSVLGTAQLLKLSNYQPFVFPVGTLMAIMTLFVFDNVMENIEFAQKVYPVYAPLVSMGIPALTLIVALLRRLPKESNA
ncbi:MAG TPA: endospore germination permease [Bacillota bacterium]|nr:endospore germination permease [Bacillota bacterium]